MPPITLQTTVRAALLTAVLAGVSVAITASLQAVLRESWDAFGIVACAIVPVITGFPALLWILGLYEQLRQSNNKLTEANRILDERATVDKLTGMKMRDPFFDAMDVARAGGEAGSLLMIDADHFKPINDRFGHAGGDVVLQRFGAIIRNSVRDQDIVGRIGGEEFAVYLPDANAEAALTVAERIRSAIEEAAIRMPTGEVISATVSVGLALAHPERTRSRLLAAGDRELYRAKRNGRNCIEVELPEKDLAVA